LGLGTVSLTSIKRFFTVWGSAAILAAVLGVISPYVQTLDQTSDALDPIVSVAQVVATFDDAAAYNMLIRHGHRAAAETMIIKQGTADWRRKIWRSAWASLKTPQQLWMGHAYGMDITPLVPDGQEIHTPHNFVIYALYYTGCIGVACFLLMLMG